VVGYFTSDSATLPKQTKPNFGNEENGILHEEVNADVYRSFETTVAQGRGKSWLKNGAYSPISTFKLFAYSFQLFHSPLGCFFSLIKLCKNTHEKQIFEYLPSAQRLTR